MASPKTAAMVTIVTTNLLVMLAIAPLSAILPTVAHHFHVEATTASWVMTAYLLSFTSLLLISGRLGDLYGHRQVFLVGAILYTIVGTLSGFVQDISILIVVRLVQGVGAAMISGNSLAILTHVFTPRERGMAIGITGLSASAGVLLGVVVSSVLAQYLSWQWVFFLTLPLGLFGIKSALDLKIDFRPPQRPKIDVWGAILLAIVLASFSLSLSHLHAGEATFAGGWYYHTGMLVATVVSLLLFVVVERRAPQPMVVLSYLRPGTFSSAIVANEILHMTMIASTFLMPFLLQSGRGLTPMHTAGLLIATQIGNILTSPLSGVIYDRTGWRFLCPVAMAFVGVGLAVMALFAPTMPYLDLLIVSFILGMSLGFFQTPNNTIIMSSVPSHLRGFAAGMLDTSRQLGHMLGIGASSAVMGLALGQAAAGLDLGTAYIAGYQQATLVAAGIAFLGVFIALGHTRSRSVAIETAPSV